MVCQTMKQITVTCIYCQTEDDVLLKDFHVYNGYYCCGCFGRSREIGIDCGSCAARLYPRYLTNNPKYISREQWRAKFEQ